VFDLFEYLLRFFGVIPETLFQALYLEFFYFFKFAGNVKDIVLKPRSGTGVRETVPLSS